VRPKQMQVFARIHVFATSSGFWRLVQWVGYEGTWQSAQSCRQPTNTSRSSAHCVSCYVECIARGCWRGKVLKTVTNPLEVEAFKISAVTVVTSIW